MLTGQKHIYQLCVMEFDCSVPFLCLSSALVEQIVRPSGLTLESTPGNGSLRLAAPGLPRRCLDMFGFCFLSLPPLTTNLLDLYNIFCISLISL